jgi:signal transduction histidine kinase
MIFKPGLRARVAWSFALFSMLLVTAQTAAILFVTNGQEEEFINNFLTDEMRELVEHYRQNPHADPPHASDLSRYIVRTADERAAVPSYLQDLPAGTHEIFVGDKEFHVEVRREDGADFYLSYNASRHEERIAKFRTFLLLGVLTMAAITIWLGYWLSGLLVRQVSDLAQRVASRAPGEERPLAANYRDEEVLTLAQAFDGYHQRMTALLRREKEFTGNLSHELRTPLTSITTSCELLADDTSISGKAKTRVEAIANAAKRIEHAMRGLLLLAREAPSAEEEAVSLKELIVEALEPHRRQLAAKGIAVELRVPEDSVLHVHRAALHLALSNLINNAAAYTERGSIVFSYDDSKLAISDTGVGIVDTDLPHIFERHYRGQTSHREGSGLGLTIVTRIAERFGWAISVQSQPDRGSTFALQFPASSDS